MNNRTNAPGAVLSRSRVLIVVPVPQFFLKCGGIGGHIAHLRGVVSGFLECGYDVDILAGPQDATPPDLAPHFVECATALRGFAGFYPLWAERLLQAVREYVGGSRPNLVYCRHSTRFAAWFSRLSGSCRGVPIVLEVNSINARGIPVLHYFEGKALRNADRILCVSQAWSCRIRAEFGEALATRLLTIPNGVTPSRFIQPASYPEGKRVATIVYAGVLKAGYGLEDLLEAARLLRQRYRLWTLHIVGSGEYEKELRNRARSLDCVKFLGSVPADCIPQILAEADIAVSPAGAGNRDNCPIKLLEYMAAGKAIVQARTEAAEKILGEGSLGLLYQPGSAMDLADALGRLIANRELRAELGNKARRSALTDHSWQARIRQLEEHVFSRNVAADAVTDQHF